MSLAKKLTSGPAIIYHPGTGYVVLFLSLLLTGLAWYFSVEYAKNRAQDKFQFQVAEIESTIRQRMDQYARVLQAGVGLFAASESVRRDEWNRFVSSLDIGRNYPGTQGIGVSVPIEPKDLAAHVSEIRAEGFPDYSVRPDGERSLYTSIIYLEPFDWRNRRAFGFDMYSEPMRRAAMDQAIATGQPTISGKVTLVQETEKDIQAGFLMYAPIYRSQMPAEASVAVRRDSFEGFVYAVLRGGDLMENLLELIGDDITLQVFDQQVDPGTILYSSGPESTSDEAGTLSSAHKIKMYGQQWIVSVKRNADLSATGEYRQSTMVGVFGLLIDFLLFYTIHLIGRQRRQMDRRRYTEELESANAKLQQVNNDLELTNANLGKSNSDLEAFAYAASHDLKSPLRAMSSLAGFIKDDAGEVLPEESSKHLDMLQSRARRLDGLLDDMIEYARVGGDQNHDAIVDMASMANALVELIDVPPGFTVALDIDVPPVLSQVVPLRQVLMNLIGNGLKHHDREKGEIKVHARYVDGQIECVVSDDGPGIPEKFRSQVFEMFKTLQSRDRQEGSGMGLTLVKKYVEVNGGALRFLPNTDTERGLHAHFTWPARLAK